MSTCPGCSGKCLECPSQEGMSLGSSVAFIIATLNLFFFFRSICDAREMAYQLRAHTVNILKCIFIFFWKESTLLRKGWLVSFASFPGLNFPIIADLKAPAWYLFFNEEGTRPAECSSGTSRLRHMTGRQKMCQSRRYLIGSLGNWCFNTTILIKHADKGLE